MLLALFSDSSCPHLEYGGTIWCSPGVEEIVFASGDKPLASVSKLEREDTGVMEVELVLLLVVDVQHLYITTLHPAVNHVQHILSDFT